MSNYILTSDGELYHYGVKGQKWGVRRYQNVDGTLKPAGKKRYRGDKDAEKLAKTFADHLDDYNDAVRSRTRVYTVDKKGANRYDKDGKPFFDTSGGFYIQDNAKIDKSRASMVKYDNLKAMMNKKYDSVVSNAKYDIETGKASIEVSLTKHGKTYVTEYTKEYGEYVEPVKFVELPDK